jgi:hypothetical protein
VGLYYFIELIKLRKYYGTITKEKTFNSTEGPTPGSYYPTQGKYQYLQAL